MKDDCTPVPPDGWRLLSNGERIEEGDMYCLGLGHSWHTTRSCAGQRFNIRTHWQMARKVTLTDNQKEQHGLS